MKHHHIHAMLLAPTPSRLRKRHGPVGGTLDEQYPTNALLEEAAHDFHGKQRSFWPFQRALWTSKKQITAAVLSLLVLMSLSALFFSNRAIFPSFSSTSIRSSVHSSMVIYHPDMQFFHWYKTPSRDSPFYQALKPKPRVLRPDYAGLQIILTKNQSNSQKNDVLVYNQERRAFLKAIDDKHGGKYDNLWNDLEYDPSACVPPHWIYQIYANCNTFHETAVLERPPQEPLQDYDVQYLASGYYRDTFLMKPTSTHSAPVVLKHLRLKESFDFGAKNLNSIHSEAMVMEILASSNRTTDFYGFCATSITMASE